MHVDMAREMALVRMDGGFAGMARALYGFCRATGLQVRLCGIPSHVSTTSLPLSPNVSLTLSSSISLVVIGCASGQVVILGLIEESSLDPFVDKRGAA